MAELKFNVISDKKYRLGAEIERDGVHFGCYSTSEVPPVLLLYQKGSQDVFCEIPFPEHSSGHFYSMKVKLRPSSFEYNFREGDKIYPDPFARKIVGRSSFGAELDASPHAVRSSFVWKAFDWEKDQYPDIPYADAVMYHLHVRGFTKQKNSGVRKKGTFAGIQEKLPYLKSLGINQLKLMPAYEFLELTEKHPADGRPASVAYSASERIFQKNFWGYGAGYYFAPKASYCAGIDSDLEFKELVKAAHKAGIELIMEFHFTDEIPFSLISECLHYWVQEYHVDGFAIIARESVAAELAKLPLFTDRKLLCNWFPQQILQENEKKELIQLSKRTSRSGHQIPEQENLFSLPAKIAESNDGFMNDCRRLLRGDEDALQNFVFRANRNQRGCKIMNYITNHDGFTLEDLVSYDHKYNRENGEQERDGTDYNYSWNCGIDGPTRKKEILRLRLQQKKNAMAMLLLSQGTPMLLAGDEFGNSQNGNNNPYCHDSELTWLSWNRLKNNQELWNFVQKAIAYRKEHKVLHQNRILQCVDNHSDGIPDLSYHGERAWYCDFSRADRHIGCLYSGRYAGEKGLIYIAYNLYWTEQKFALPILPKNTIWYKVMDTSLEESFLTEVQPIGREKSFSVPGRTIMILEGRENETLLQSEKNHLEKGKRSL